MFISIHFLKLDEILALHKTLEKSINNLDIDLLNAQYAG
jgi:hypothetical protein